MFYFSVNTFKGPDNILNALKDKDFPSGDNEAVSVSTVGPGCLVSNALLIICLFLLPKLSEKKQGLEFSTELWNSNFFHCDFGHSVDRCKSI